MSEEKEGEPQEPVDTTLLTKQANEAAERLEKANKKQEELLAKAALTTALGGQAEAGQPAKKEESDADYAKKVMANDIETK